MGLAKRGFEVRLRVGFGIRVSIKPCFNPLSNPHTAVQESAGSAAFRGSSGEERRGGTAAAGDASAYRGGPRGC